MLLFSPSDTLFPISGDGGRQRSVGSIAMGGIVVGKSGEAEQTGALSGTGGHDACLV